MVFSSLRSSGYRKYLAKRVVAVISYRLIRLGRSKFLRRRAVNGRTLRFELRDHTQCLFYFGVSPEPENSALLRAIGSASGGDLIDVGANFGQQPFEIRNGFRKMLLLEPNPKAAGFLRELFYGDEGVEILERPERLTLLAAPRFSFQMKNNRALPGSNPAPAGLKLL